MVHTKQCRLCEAERHKDFTCYVHSVQSKRNTECKANTERWNVSICGMPSVSSRVYEANGRSRSLRSKSWTLHVLCQPQGKTVVDSHILLLTWHGCSQLLHFVPVSTSTKSDDTAGISCCSFPRTGVWTIISTPQILIGAGLVVYEVSSLWQKRMKMMGVPDNIRLQQGNHFPAQISTFRRCCLCSSRTNNKRSRIICSQCNVSLCVVPWFGIFHKRWLEQPVSACEKCQSTAQHRVTHCMGCKFQQWTSNWTELNCTECNVYLVFVALVLQEFDLYVLRKSLHVSWGPEANTLPQVASSRDPLASRPILPKTLNSKNNLH